MLFSTYCHCSSSIASIVLVWQELVPTVDSFTHTTLFLLWSVIVDAVVFLPPPVPRTSAIKLRRGFRRASEELWRCFGRTLEELRKSFGGASEELRRSFGGTSKGRWRNIGFTFEQFV